MFATLAQCHSPIPLLYFRIKVHVCWNKLKAHLPYIANALSDYHCSLLCNYLVVSSGRRCYRCHCARYSFYAAYSFIPLYAVTTASIRSYSTRKLIYGAEMSIHIVNKVALVHRAHVLKQLSTWRWQLQHEEAAPGELFTLQPSRQDEDKQWQQQRSQQRGIAIRTGGKAAKPTTESEWDSQRRDGITRDGESCLKGWRRVQMDNRPHSVKVDE